MLISMPSPRQLITILSAALASLLILSLIIPSSRDTVRDLVREKLPGVDNKPSSNNEEKRPKYKPTPTYTPPPVKENFPLLATSTPPPIPKWNVPPPDLHKEYDLPVAPPLLIGFTRTWPLLQQAVVSYITAGWPPSQIYVVENTGVQQSNVRGQLSLQNPFYLNHAALKKLGVNVVTTPTLLSFAQMQNFFLSLTYTHKWPYYFWSHMDVVAYAYEDGKPGLSGKYNEKNYKSLYELALVALKEAREKDDRWGIRFFAYDHLALVNPAAFEDVGGWDTHIPYYMTDCDMHSKLIMRNWTQKDAKAGIITDVASALADLSVLYRLEGGPEPSFVDPNPPPPKKEEKEKKGKSRIKRVGYGEDGGPLPADRDKREEDPNWRKWRNLVITADKQFQHKHGDRERNTWQLGQQGGKGEPFYYPAVGLAKSIELMTETGREVFRQKWGHRGCDLVSGAKLKYDDAWMVEKDW
ncbi:hypothetical protein QC761_512130 [Podospora bellae-mahoneyi]|uniref:Glycosyltransferase Family 8 n=1 Tax=Podospora bellae-mahoneyi TaxID=2093777 RepID=A0ABR0FDQ8_9PEZI|nr:hypothetical protein QC761_512130 [Podospora bellae-mahoneyi]